MNITADDLLNMTEEQLNAIPIEVLKRLTQGKN
jgi:hypothetical protein